MDESLPNAKYESSYNIAGIEIKAYVLDDGRRILDMDGVNRLLAFIAGGNDLTGEDELALLDAKDGRSVMQRINPTE